MRRRRFPIFRILLLFLLLGGIAFAFRQGLIPARYSPLPLVDLGSPPGIFVDWQLASLRREPELCRRVLREPHIDAVSVEDNPIRNGCGWTNTVRFDSISGARLSVDKLSCETAAALALWMINDVQPVAVSMLGQRVASVQDLGTYSCRNIIGSALWKNKRSEHATANAIDIAGFTLADGRQINIARDWAGNGAEARFLRAAHQSACRYFRVALGPDFNRSHRNHFHLDRGILWTCG
ncbi:MAG TPA: extensin family protein [Hyphomicrobiaceae bacterium]|nr:extensin family protein [Hyphomicrobiaceae bacterium]